MKKIVCLVFAIFLSLSLFAQKRTVEYVKKTNAVLVDGEQWASITKMKAGYPYLDMFVLKDMQGKEIAYAKTFAEVGAKSYEIQFAASGQVIKKEFDMFISTPKDFAKFFVQNELLTKEGFNPEAERRVVAAFGQTTTRPDINSGTNSPSTSNQTPQNSDFLERNRNAKIFVFGDKIQQDFKDIGSISNSNQTAQGAIVTIYKVFNHQNQLIAEATTELNGKNISLITIKDNKRHQLQSEDIGFASVKEKIAKYLVDRYYW